MSFLQFSRRLARARFLRPALRWRSGSARTSFDHVFSLHLALFLFLSAFVRCVQGQKDPVTNFCRRFSHQTAVIDRKLYIDGGMVNWNLQTDPTNYTNTWLSYQDLDVQGSAGMPQLYANLSKNASIPSVSGGILWADDVNKRFYLFGGEYYPQQRPSDFVLYGYDTIFNKWDSFGAPPPTVRSVSYGAGVSISATGEAYYYGGWLSNSTVPGWTGLPAATTGLVRYRMDSNEWSNNTGPDNVKRAEGSMVYIPASDGGMLVYFGGIQDLGNGSITGQPMDKILIYDIYASRWFTQTATGAIPGLRRRFCAGVSWPADQSSYNIYIYGGSGFAQNETGYDDVFILSLPSFQWIKWYPTENNDKPNGEYPHHSLTCNVISGAQMLIIGGSFPLDQTCDAPTQFGTHNLDLGKQNERHVGWNLFQPNLTTYVVPDTIYDTVGGGPLGGATKTAPVAGFEQSDLKVLMTRKASVATRTPTRSIPGPTNAPSGQVLSTGIIVGIAVGGGVAAILLATVCGVFISRHRKKHAQPWEPGPADPNRYFSRADTHSEMSGSGPWSPHTRGGSSHSPSAGYVTPYFRHPRPPSSSTVRGTVAGGGGRPVELADEGPPVHRHLYPGTGMGPTLTPTTEAKSPSSTASQVHVDENGIVWVPQVSPGTVGGSPLDFQPSPRTPGAGAEPLELSPDPRPDRYWLGVEGGTGTRDETNSAQDWDNATSRTSVHQTFYHP